MTTSKRPNPALTAEQSARIVAGMKVLNKMAHAPAPAAADASWDAVHADTAKRMGVELVEGDIKKTERAAAAARVTTGAAMPGTMSWLRPM